MFKVVVRMFYSFTYTHIRNSKTLISAQIHILLCNTQPNVLNEEWRRFKASPVLIFGVQHSR